MGRMAPAAPEHLVWLAPEGSDREAFARLRQQLLDLLVSPAGEEVYTAKRRTIYRSSSAPLGSVGIKEMRNPGCLRRLWHRHLREHRGLREFRVGSRFRARGGHTPELLACALEQWPLSLRRVFVFVRWRDGARTLREQLAGRGVDPGPELLCALAAELVAAARLGLVHGRHSGDNLLVVEGPGGPAFETIDFAYSRLADGFDERGFVADVVRIAATLVLTAACSRQAASELLDAVARAGWSPPQAPRARAHLDRELERFLARIPPRRPAAGGPGHG